MFPEIWIFFEKSWFLFSPCLLLEPMSGRVVLVGSGFLVALGEKVTKGPGHLRRARV